MNYKIPMIDGRPDWYGLDEHICAVSTPEDGQIILQALYQLGKSVGWNQGREDAAKVAGKWDREGGRRDLIPGAIRALKEPTT